MIYVIRYFASEFIVFLSFSKLSMRKLIPSECACVDSVQLSQWNREKATNCKQSKSK